MGFLVGVLAALLGCSGAFIFYLLKVLKNTLNIVEEMSELAQGRTPRRMQEAYDGKYYPATVIAQVKFNSPSEGKITDWSRYEDKKIVGFTIMTTDKIEDYYGKEFIEALPQEDLEELEKPVIIKNVLVYAPSEGDWMWKSA
jgi:hypothetical protein